MKLDLSFFKPRTGMQQTALDRLAELDARYTLLSLPVGAGKSFIALAAARGAGSAYIVTPQNILIEQYRKNFPGVPIVKGRSHYCCHWARGMNCADASEAYQGQHTAKCRDYIPARDAFWASRISVTNLHYAQFAHRMDGQRRLLIVDECHGLEPMLLSLFHTTILRKDAEALGVDFNDSNLERLIAGYAGRVPEDYECPAFVRQVPDAHQRERMRGTARRLVQIKLHDKQNPWHTNRSPEMIECRPLFARNLAPHLMELGERVLFMSATPGSPEHFFRNLGIEPGADTAFVEVDSDFPRGKGIVLVKGAQYVLSERLEQQLPELARLCGLIMRQLPCEKGLILCASYKLARMLTESLRGEFGHRLVTHDPSNRDEAVAKHVSAPRPTVLIAVNMHEGLDMRDDLARFLIIPKVLYTARDTWEIERDRLDPGYYQHLTVSRMVQACGRVKRDSKDWSYIHILDGQMRKLVSMARAEFPAYFLRDFVETDYVD